MTAFRIDQVTPGVGVAGHSRHDLIVGEVITLTATTPSGGGVTYTWEIIDKVGSSATLSSTTGTTVTIGNAGAIAQACAFLVRCTSNDAGTVDYVDRIASVRLTTSGLRLPVFSETAPQSSRLNSHTADSSTDNAVYTDRAGLGAAEQNWRGWAEWAYEVALAVEAASGVSGGLTDGDKGDVVVSSAGTVWTVDAKAVTLAKMADIASDRLIGRDTAGPGVPEALTVSGGLEFTGSTGIQRSALTGDVTASAGSNATTIANDAVTNAKAANMAEATIKGRAVGAGTGDPTDLTPAQAAAILVPVVENVAGTTYTIVPGDANKIKRFTNASGCTVDLATSAGDIFVDLLAAASAGTVVVDPNTSVTLNGGTSNVSMGTAPSVVSLIPVPGASGSFELVGNLAGGGATVSAFTILAATDVDASVGPGEVRPTFFTAFQVLSIALDTITGPDVGLEAMVQRNDGVPMEIFISPSGGNTINGSTASILLSEPFGLRRLLVQSSTNWVVVI